MKNTLLMKNHQGQSTIEFLFALTIAFGFVFGLFRMAVVYTNGYYVHYVTFMASRAFMVAENNARDFGANESEGRERANRILTNYAVSSLIPGFDGVLEFENPSENSTPGKNLFIGARLSFSTSLMAPGSGAKIEIPLTSESYLGMEPLRNECFERICHEMRQVGPGSGCFNHATVSDNGC